MSRGTNRRQISFGNVQVSPANPTRKHAQQHITRLRLRTGDFLDLKKWFRRWSARDKDGCLHGVSLLLAALRSEFLAQLVGVQRVLVRLFRQFMTRQMISLIVSDCCGGMRVGGKIMKFYEAIRKSSASWVYSCLIGMRMAKQQDHRASSS